MSYDYDGYGVGAALFALILGFVIFYLVILLASYVLMAATLMVFFRKVGVEPWIAWVPVYNYWKWLEVGGQAGWFALLVFVPGGNYVYLVFHIIGMYRTGKAFGKDVGFTVLGVFLPFVWALLLGGRDEVYRPERFAEFGWPPPLAGYGSAPRPGA